MSNLRNEALKSAESTLMNVAEAVLSGRALRIIAPLHDDENIVRPDSLLKHPYATEMIDALQSSKPDLKMYVEKYLIPVADHYRGAADYLQKTHHISLASEEYEEWRATLVDRADQYLQSEYFQLKNDEGWQIGGPKRVTDPVLEDIEILAAVAVLESATQISERLVLSNRAVSCKLDAIVQLAELHSFCDTSYELLNIQAIKESGHHETQSKNRGKGHKKVRQETRNKLSRLIRGNETSKYFHSSGKKVGQPKMSYIVGTLQSDQWNCKMPGETLMREEIHNFLRKSVITGAND